MSSAFSIPPISSPLPPPSPWISSVPLHPHWPRPLTMTARADPWPVSATFSYSHPAFHSPVKGSLREKERKRGRKEEREEERKKRKEGKSKTCLNSKWLFIKARLRKMKTPWYGMACLQLPHPHLDTTCRSWASLHSFAESFIKCRALLQALMTQRWKDTLLRGTSSQVPLDMLWLPPRTASSLWVAL